MTILKFRRQPNWLRAIASLFQSAVLHQQDRAAERDPKSAIYNPKQFRRRWADEAL
ncbi:hypothetical protein ACU4GD_43300 [Cupriavidus basilensis]